jgi:hypothetical protein
MKKELIKKEILENKEELEKWYMDLPRDLSEKTYFKIFKLIEEKYGFQHLRLLCLKTFFKGLEKSFKEAK